MVGELTTKVCGLDWCHEPILPGERRILSHTKHVHDDCAYVFDVVDMVPEEFPCWEEKWCKDADQTKAVWIHYGACPTETAYRSKVGFLAIGAGFLIGEFMEATWPGGYSGSILFGFFVLVLIVEGIWEWHRRWNRPNEDDGTYIEPERDDMDTGGG